MNAPRTLTRTDWWLALGLFAVALWLRVPFRAAYAWHWDGAQFALAVLDYDLAAGQPHAPGFPLYVMLGKCLLPLTGDAHLALVWVSVVAGSALVALGFLLATAMFDRRVAWGTAVILLTSPLVWFHSEVALTTIVDAALVTSLMLACWQRRLFWMGLLFVAVSGVRWQTAVALLPFWGWMLWRERGVAARVWWLLALLPAAVWGIIHFELILLKAQFDRPKTLWGGGGWNSLVTIGWALWIGLLLATPMVVLGIRRAHRFLWWWLGPLLAFGILTYTTMPGYVLSYFPAVAILAGLGMTRLQAPRVAWFAVAAVNLTVFLGTRYGLTAQTLADHDQAMAHTFATIRAAYPAEDTVIEHRQQHFFFGFRQFQYHLPEYRNVLVAADASLPGRRGQQFWVGYQRETAFVDSPPAARHHLVVEPTDQTIRERGSAIVSPDGK